MDAALSSPIRVMGSNATEGDVLVGITDGILEGVLSKLAIVSMVFCNVHIV